MLGVDDRQGNVQPHACSLLGLDQIFSRGLEEIHGRPVLEGRRVRQIDDDLRTFEHFGKTFASDYIDAGIGRRCNSLMPELRQLAHDLRTDQSGSSDYYDLHEFAFSLNVWPMSVSNGGRPARGGAEANLRDARGAHGRP